MLIGVQYDSLADRKRLQVLGWDKFRVVHAPWVRGYFQRGVFHLHEVSARELARRMIPEHSHDGSTATRIIPETFAVSENSLWFFDKAWWKTGWGL